MTGQQLYIMIGVSILFNAVFFAIGIACIDARFQALLKRFDDHIRAIKEARPNVLFN